MLNEIGDPRVFPQREDRVHAAVIALAQASLSASSVTRAAACDRAIGEAIADLLRAGDPEGLVDLFAAAPSAAVARHLSRRLIAAWDEGTGSIAGEGLAAVLFAFPLVVVVGAEAAEAGAEATRALPGVLPGVLAEAARIGEILSHERALADNQAFALSNALIGPGALDLPRLPELFAWQRLPEAGITSPRQLEGSEIPLDPALETVHLRFLAGSALVAPNRTLVGAKDTGTWGRPVARELSRQLGQPGVSVLALPRPPQAPYLALQVGRAAQREVSAQLFASNAIRHLRAGVGEPAAVISAHACPDAPGGGELRLSLSSVFDPREAQGLRCPLYTGDRVNDVVTMLVDLLHDCRVSEIRVLGGVFPDRDPETGVRLLFKADAVAEREQLLH